MKLGKINKKINPSWFKRGHKLSPESELIRRKHISESKRGKSTWNKGKCLTEEWKRKISEANKGKKKYEMTEEIRKKISLSHKGLNNWSRGKRLSDEHREKLSRANWMGGLTTINKLIRSKLEYELWRKEVFKKDNYACQMCGARSVIGRKVILNADHIKPFSLYPELRFAVDNGRALCIDCHKTTNTYGGKIRNYAKT